MTKQQKFVNNLQNLFESTSKCIQETKELLAQAKKINKKEKIKIYEMNLQKLINLQDAIKINIIHLEKECNNSIVSSFIGLSSNIILFQHLLTILNPQEIDFPFRFFYSSVTADIYSKIRDMWYQNKTKNEILDYLSKFTSKKKYFHNLTTLYQGLAKANISDTRESYFKELSIVYRKKCYLATSLLAITQTEGIIWDFSEYLNRKDFKIFEKQNGHYYPYTLDNRSRKYNLDKKYYITSIRQILLKTRMGEIIPFDLYSYLISEYYDDRIYIAHGNIAGRNLKSDAIAALLVLRAVIMLAHQYTENAYVSAKL